MSSKRPRLGALLLACSLLPCLTEANNSFKLLPLPAGAVSSTVGGISRDGTAVVGDYKTSTKDFAFRWMSAGVVTLQRLNSNATGQYGAGASNGGAVVVGGEYDGGSNFLKGFVWNGSTTAFGDLTTTYPYSQAAAVSNDGLTMTGTAYTLSGAYHPVRKTAAGMVDLGVYTGDSLGEGLGISGDGKVIVGFSRQTAYHALEWLAPTYALHLLPKHGTDPYSVAYGTNLDGSIVVGATGAGYGANGACKWFAGTVTYLGLPPYTEYISGGSVSDDGKVMVFNVGATAYLWTPQSGFIGLADYLTSRGVNLQNNTLLDGVVSANGVSIAGTASNNGVYHAYLATITPPPSLKGFTMAQTTILDTAKDTGTVTLTEPALQDTVIALSSSNPAALSVPSAITIKKGTSYATFTATAHTVAASKKVGIKAALHYTSWFAGVTVNP